MMGDTEVDADGYDVALKVRTHWRALSWAERRG